MTKMIAYICAAGMVLLASGCSSMYELSSTPDTSRLSATESTTEPTTEETTSEPLTENNSDPDGESSLSSDDICSILRTNLEEELGDNVTVEYNEDSKNYVVSMWQDGIAMTLISYTTNPDAQAAWDNLRETMKSTSLNLLDTVQNAQPDAHVTVMVLNDVDHSRTFLTVLDGVILSDVADELTASE